MIDWKITNRELSGDSTAADWRKAIPNVSEMLEKALDECVSLHGSALYVEMWPDTGRFICYPANPPQGGKLSERTTEFVVQVSFPFWQDAWLSISLDATDAELRYLELKAGAVDALVKAFKKCESGRPELRQVVLFAFEFEGSEGVTVITNDEISDHR